MNDRTLFWEQRVVRSNLTARPIFQWVAIAAAGASVFSADALACEPIDIGLSDSP